MKRYLYAFLSSLSPLLLWAQLQLSHPHGFYDQPFALTLSDADGLTIHYTLDGSEPSVDSPVYAEALTISSTTILRAAGFAAAGVPVTDIVTATYLFPADILQQDNSPEGYPKEWGRYTQISGRAIADYEMDPEMTSDAVLRPKILEGLTSLPALSIVTYRDCLFSHENDPDRGGIYIFTGPPVGDNTGHGWTRPTSIELFGAQGYDLSTTCGLRLHGGHGRLAEKNPKHSFRLVFKEMYGPKTLNYPLFGEGEPTKFNQLVLRCHFGNSWQHWNNGNRQKAQYTRDVWARRMQRKIGRTSVNALYVNVFINGMYWGVYNLAERVDDQYGKTYLGGSKSDIDVIKIEEDGGNHIEASEGTLDAWELMLSTVSRAADSADAYQQLSDSLLDIDAFIDYMIINQYIGNTDWDHHNWYAIRRRGSDSQGFRFLCWDSEVIFESENENVLEVDNGKASPTGIFHRLLRNEDFALRYLRRAKVLLADDGMLGEQSVVTLWDSLYHTIHAALYAESARWGDYRRDVHRWQSKGELYTVDNQFMAERQRLLDSYFPVRSANVLQQIQDYVGIDDFEVPDGWELLTASMFKEWDSTGADAQPNGHSVHVDWNMGVEAAGGTTIAGFSNVDHNQFADLSDYDYLVLRGTGRNLRILANRLVAHGPWKQIMVSFTSSDPYWDHDLQAIKFPLADLKTSPTNEGVSRPDDFVHLNALKVDWTSTANVRSAYLIPSAERLDIENTLARRNSDGIYYNLLGQPVPHPTPGIYIRNGRKIYVK
ncbi:MAG: CotH kinase family protein [Prevotella sp.]|nr:CotH kinase family protein [Prevotella sp.]